MKLICMVKYVPDVDNFNYDYENNVLIRENSRLTLNPDDVCAVAFALGVKAQLPQTHIEVVTMAPLTVKPHMEDLIRLGVDQGTLIADKVFAGSDTYVTSLVLGRYLLSQDFDLVLSGTHAIDGDTSHIPSQLGAILGLNQVSNIVHVHKMDKTQHTVLVDVDVEDAVETYEMTLPAILSFTRESHYKLPYIKRQDINRDVSDCLHVLTHVDLGFEADQVGLKGSPTKVVRTYSKTFNQKQKTIVQVDNEGIEAVYEFLKDKGFI